MSGKTNDNDKNTQIAHDSSLLLVVERKSTSADDRNTWAIVFLPPYMQTLLNHNKIRQLKVPKHHSWILLDNV